MQNINNILHVKGLGLVSCELVFNQPKNDFNKLSNMLTLT